jgi:HAD superfamily hydrolase (TIGR01549 family)
LFLDYYRNEFQNVKDVCGFAPEARLIISTLQSAGKRVVLATNPLFPAIATLSRAKWAGLNPEDFALITTYENSAFCKPNPDYYREILGKLNLKPEECLMVGNDVQEDMVARSLGMEVFLLTDCIINRDGTDISQFPHGGFDQLLEHLRSL